MTDLREKVANERGLIKKLQLAIPGFRGYRLREDVRIADSMLRIQLADYLNTNVLRGLESVRETAGNNLELDLMNDIATVISQAKTLESRIRHAEQGYSGISPAYHVEEADLNELYQYDLSLLDEISAATAATQSAVAAANSGDFSETAVCLREVKSDLGTLRSAFEKRIETMAELGAF
ncbi:MAG: hypothetical protein LBL85_02930 [Methanocalculaceae archaeon]|jgi:hypothetical protein|nr:hypothetical protein [Methanocalculaceae archaeon]